MRRLVIGIAGGTGSGKTTVAKRLTESFGLDSVTLSHDFYYKDNKDMPYEERAKQNYDHPNSLDTELLVEHVKQLRDGKRIKHPTYDFSKHLRCPEWITMEPSDIIIVEGILIFENKELRDLMDIKIFVDTDADVRFVRRLNRDINDRGRSVQSVIDQWLSTVKPMHDRFVEPSKRYADIIVPEGGHNDVAVEMLIEGIGSKVKR